MGHRRYHTEGLTQEQLRGRIERTKEYIQHLNDCAKSIRARPMYPPRRKIWLEPYVLERRRARYELKVLQQALEEGGER
jgi:hypothetical protein